MNIESCKMNCKICVEAINCPALCAAHLVAFFCHYFRENRIDSYNESKNQRRGGENGENINQ